jgi:hypothetical protein
MDPPTPPAPSEPFELGEEIGSGAIATVFRVLDRRTDEWLAAKLLHPRHERDEAARGRFRREAELASRLRHENVVAVYGIAEMTGRTALLMELVEGPTLAAHLARAGTLQEPELVAYARGIASGLAFAHGSGVIHRDLKPANVLLHDGSPRVPKLADFGMARAASFANADRKAMTVLGTPPYMAPECLDPLAVDPRTDLYALGCIMYEMATGRPPFGGATPFAVLEAHRSAAIPELPEAHSPSLRALVRKLLAKAPGDRPQSASAVVDALDEVMGSTTALVARAAPRDAAAGTCAGCGAEILPEVRVCFRCGLVQAMVEPGPYTVFVVGPGLISHKLDTERRDRLVSWLRANQGAGFDATALERRIPRLPFPLIIGVSDRSAQTLVDSLQRLGLLMEVRVGDGLSHEGVRKSASMMTRRIITFIVAISGAGVLVNPLFGLVPMLVVVPIAYGIVRALARGKAALPLVHSTKATRTALPSRLQERLDALYGRVHDVVERRHRDALRAVVHRTVGLTRALSPAAQAEVDEEMSQAVDLAAAAATRMDELDRAMAEPDFDPSHADHRNLMHERDMWSARLLDLTATLDALAARRASAQAKLQAEDDDEIVSSLRHTVEALEEVRRI